MSDDQNTPIWKKEISFRRKPDEAAPASEPGSSSLWKKEISFGKKPKEADADGGSGAEAEVVAQPEAPLEAAPAVDLDLIARYAPLPEPVAAPAALPSAPVEPAPIEHDWLTKPLEEVSAPPEEPLALVPDLLPEAHPSPISLVPPVEEPMSVVSPVPAFAVEPVAPPEPLVAAEPTPVASPDELDLDLPPAIVAPYLPPAAIAPELAIAALPELPPTQPVDVPVVVPEAEVETVEVRTAGVPKVPFYKKDFSLKRGSSEPKQKKERKPKAARKPKLKRGAVEEPKPEIGAGEAAAPVTADSKTERKKPFYKRDFSFKRSTNEWDAAEPAVSKPKAPKSKMLRLPRPKPSASKVSRPGSGAKKLVGLKIGGSQIAAARVHNNGSSPELMQVVREPLDHGIVVGGELRDPEALALALRDFFKLHNLPKRGIRLGIANNRIGVRTFDVTGINDPKQLANAIRFRAQEVLPIPIEDAVLDYQVLSESVNAEGQPVSRVLLVVAYRELVDRYVYACEKAGLQIVGIDLEAFALLRAIGEPHDPVPGAERGAVVAVSVGHDRSTFAVSDGRICEFTRVLEWGGWSLNVAIARALDMSPSEAEPIKRMLSFGEQTATPDGFSEDQLAAAHEAARRQLQTFARELVSSLQFYQNQPGSLGIGEIVLTGGTTHLPGLSAELERLIGVPIRVADPFGRVKVSKKVRERDQIGSFAVAIGLGIED
jgi:type IV pilus assembly protein PilM